MLEWFTRKKKRSELPEYSALRAVPTRALPSDLAEEESGESFAGRADGIERDLRDPAHLPGVDIPLFTELISSGGKSVVSIPMPDEGGLCLPVFSTSFRAADYQRTLLTSGPAVQYLSSSATQLFGMLRDLEKFRITNFTLDRCPRCPTFPAYGGSSLKTPPDLLVVWAVHKATKLARMELYFRYALNSARAGRLETARDVLLETVGHVDAENPRPHLLLGELGLALGDRTMLREAQEFLRFLGHDRWKRRLDDIVRAGQPNFEDLD